MNAKRIAIRLMIIQCVLFATETMVVHQIGPGASIMQLALVRGAAGVVLALIIGKHIGLAVIRTQQLSLQLVRGTVSLLYLWVMMYSFGHLPLADATAISYTQSAYIAVFSVLLLGEAVNGARWSAAAVGIFGALLIARPDFGDWSSGYFVALVGTGLNGLSFVLNRYLQRRDSDATTMFYTSLVPVLGNAPILAFASPPSAETLLWLPSLLFLGPLGVYCGIRAVKYADASALGPYTLLRLVITIAAGVIIFRELPDIWSSAGACLIVLSCVISSVPMKSWRVLSGTPRFVEDLVRWRAQVRSRALYKGTAALDRY